MGEGHNPGNGNSRCKDHEVGGNLEHWRNRGKVRITRAF